MIKGVKIINLRSIKNGSNFLRDGIKNSELKDKKFGEIYTSTISYKEIRAWKLHHLCAHLLDVIFMYGCVGIWNEEAVESFHQLTKKHFVTLSALPPKIFMEQLFHRYLNEWDVNMNNRS